ncbi:hypothetical protein DERP_001067 [Dermatophagoides pteronyssinus]|uniref:MULE transposase domain-containing protein n=1 Tax=Dermatophagoides pteronyssinus TaxID=6956 RepID=A0ABQ8JDF7_DERPT|nr:hypothetical protein DERP_001067 [Dermatophagoides pteronyssinus]
MEAIDDTIDDDSMFITFFIDCFVATDYHWFLIDCVEKDGSKSGVKTVIICDVDEGRQSLSSILSLLFSRKKNLWSKSTRNLHDQ